MTQTLATPTDYDARLERCPLCDSPDLLPHDVDRRRGNTIERCRACGLRFMNPQYTDQKVRADYSYDRFEDPKPDDPLRTQIWVREECKRKSMELIGRYVDPGRVLCVGCADGLELRVAQELGWTAEGHEIHRAAGEVARKYDTTVHTEDFREIEADPFDAVLIDQVIEHVKNPRDYLTKIFDLLRPGGVLFLGAPNLDSLSNRAKTLAGKLGIRRRNRGKHYASGHHVFYFSPRVTCRFLQAIGFEILQVRGSLKRKRNKRIGAILRRWFPIMDSGFIVLARKSGSPATRSPITDTDSPVSRSAAG